MAVVGHHTLDLGHSCGFTGAIIKCLPTDVLWGWFVTHSFLPHGRGGEMNA